MHARRLLYPHIFTRHMRTCMSMCIQDTYKNNILIHSYSHDTCTYWHGTWTYPRCPASRHDSWMPLASAVYPLYIAVYTTYIQKRCMHTSSQDTCMHLCVSIYTTYTNIFACTHIHTTRTHRRCPRSTQYPSYPSAPLCTLRARALSALRKRKRPSASLPSTSAPPTSHFLPQHTPHRCTTRSTLSALLPSKNLPTRWECMRCRYALQLVFRQRALCLCVCVYIYMHIYVYSYICIAAALAPSATAAAPALQVRLMYVCIFMCMYT